MFHVISVYIILICNTNFLHRTFFGMLFFCVTTAKTCMNTYLFTKHAFTPHTITNTKKKEICMQQVGDIFTDTCNYYSKIEAQLKNSFLVTLLHCISYLVIRHYKINAINWHRNCFFVLLGKKCMLYS